MSVSAVLLFFLRFPATSCSATQQRPECTCVVENCLHLKKCQLLGVAHVLLLHSVASYRGSEYAYVQVHRVNLKRSKLLQSAA